MKIFIITACVANKNSDLLVRHKEKKCEKGVFQMERERESGCHDYFKLEQSFFCIQ